MSEDITHIPDELTYKLTYPVKGLAYFNIILCGV